MLREVDVTGAVWDKDGCILIKDEAAEHMENATGTQARDQAVCFQVKDKAA